MPIELINKPDLQISLRSTQSRPSISESRPTWRGGLHSQTVVVLSSAVCGMVKKIIKKDVAAL